MVSHMLTHRAALVVAVLLSLPGSAWAQAVLSGQVRFADGSVAGGATVYARSTASNFTQQTTADAAGQYQLQLPSGTYDVGVEFSVPGFYGSQTLVAGLSLSSDTVRNLATEDILLNGRVLNSNGQPVAGVQLVGNAFGGLSFNYLSPVSGSDGRFQVRMLPAQYFSMKLQPASGSPYMVTPLPDESFTASVSKDYVVSSAVQLSGQVRFADGSVAGGATVYARSAAGNLTLQTTADAFGQYQLQLASGTYDVGVEFSVPGFYGSQTLVTGLSLSSNTVRNLTTEDILLNGRVLNSSGQPVAGVELVGNAFGGLSFNYLSPVSGSDGRFQVRMLPAQYFSMKLQPASGSPYMVTPLPDESFTASVSRDYVVSSAVQLSGQVRFADGSVAGGATVYARSAAGNLTLQTTADAAGQYQLQLASGTYDVGVEFSVPGFYGSQTLVTGLSLSSNTVRNLTTEDILLNGRVLNSNGQPVAGVQLVGNAFGGLSFNYLSPVSGSDGRFQVRMLPAQYFSMRLQPVSNAGYQQTPLPDESFTASATRDYVVADFNECAQDNGGCSVNATCTNIPGSRTCACNSGYTGDGLTCEPNAGRVILNEILANELGSATAGEFIELVNVGSGSVDLSGWTLSDATAVRHTFASGTVLAPGKAVVVFAAASGIPSGLTNAVASTTGTLSLGNSGDTVTVKNAAGALIDSLTYPSSLGAADGVSMNRNPDANPGAGFVLHSAISALASSAGKRANGTVF